MTETMMSVTVAFAALAGVIVLALAGLRAWHEWVELQRYALSGGRRESEVPASASPAAARIELADLRERVRKLEAIAAGVDL
ncbi:hypothetical protein HL653_05340 [Sphingomonas sp. AP4-R1]|uniref:hypothetical protein n=1 Tax=Sphingomonas sp. AP4-R1 TaxID=2735134 RepID=UPI001493C862|nr:hypothetical protein [Sphingomonas sp. AP4-R1]QJU60471.1 hypothetical protein HL653_05340 [Sphingomonas sp. AP4-R1]